MTLSPLLIENMVRMALAEDLGHGHDITSQLLIPADVTAKAVFRARQDGVLAGLILALSSFAYTDPDFDIEMHAQDGQLIRKGDVIATVEGPAAALLTAERTALNFLIHMSGIATQTQKYVQAVKGTKAKICDTRKTLAGLRALQKYAVLMGGGFNHRFGLDDAILIKDNHIAIAGSVKEALKRARSNVGHMVKIEIEVDTIKQLEEVLKVGGADIVMFDNFKIPDLKKAVKMVNGKVLTEASGGVNLKTVTDIAKTGVDYISVGALTHSAPALDIGLDIDVT
jgi:nicotinate-nucleotide pyrophosphorylase (carboxylating)